MADGSFGRVAATHSLVPFQPRYPLTTCTPHTSTWESMCTPTPLVVPVYHLTPSRHGLEICEREATAALMSLPTSTLVLPPPAPVVRTLSHSCFVAPSRKAKTSASPPHRHPWYPTAWRRSPALFPGELRASAPRQPLISHGLDRHCIIFTM